MNMSKSVHFAAPYVLLCAIQRQAKQDKGMHLYVKCRLIEYHKHSLEKYLTKPFQKL